MIKIKVKDFLVNFSIILVLIVITLRPFIIGIFKSSLIPMAIFFVSSLILFSLIIRTKKIFVSKDRIKYILMCILFLIPSLYKNAYIEDSMSIYLYYPLAILFSIIIAISDVKNKNINIMFKYFFSFSVATGVVTWFSSFFPTMYLNRVVTLLPTGSQDLVIQMFVTEHAYAGLTDHYSRNAFYIILGILSCIYFYLNQQDKKKKSDKKFVIYAILLTATMFFIGKRGHLLFLVFSLIVSYFVYNRMKLKTILKFLIIFIAALFLTIISINIVPSLNNVITRFTNTSSDISTGRFDLYRQAVDLYKNRGPIGWGQFAKSTNYYFAAVHNDYIQLFVETSIVGLILIVGCNLTILLKAIKVSREKKDALTFIILFYNIFFLSYSLTGLPHYDVEVYTVYFILNALLYNQYGKIQSTYKEKQL